MEIDQPRGQEAESSSWRSAVKRPAEVDIEDSHAAAHAERGEAQKALERDSAQKRPADIPVKDLEESLDSLAERLIVE